MIIIMEIIFEDKILKKAYEFLNNVQNLDKEEGEEYLQESEEIKSIKDDLNSTGAYSLGPSELPCPLKSISFSVRRQGDFYEAYVTLFGRENENCFDDFSTNLMSKKISNKLDFIPTCSNGGGYLIENSNSLNIDYVMTYSKQKKSEYVSLVFGNSGSKLRLFGGELGDFLIDMKGLEKITNCLVSRLYDFKKISLCRLDDVQLLVS